VKRPEGFDHRSAPEPDQPSAREPKARAPRGLRGRFGIGSTPDPSEAETGPIPTVDPASSSGGGRGRVTGAPSPSTSGLGSATGQEAPARPKAGEPAPGAAAPAGARTAAAPTPTPAALRRTQRKAARARRRFERAEVRRFTRRTRRRRATWITVGAIVATLGVVLAVAVYSPILALREVTIEGTNRVSEEDVRAAVESQMGTPLALLDFGKIHSELAAFPLIRSYVTETVPPNTLRIQVVEREAIGSLARSGSFDEVDPAGVVISSSAERTALPLIEVGNKGVDSSAFASAVEVLLAMPQDVADKVDVITATTADDVSLALRETPARVVWGSADSSEMKAQVLARMLQLPECANLAVVDVSAPLAPICGPG
jgi:cell division protein FtsQ